jgi:hypothetical protein
MKTFVLIMGLFLAIMIYCWVSIRVTIQKTSQPDLPISDVSTAPQVPSPGEVENRGNNSRTTSDINSDNGNRARFEYRKATGTAHRSANSLEHKLANINSRGYVTPDHITVARFRSLLTQMARKFSEDEQQIADMSVHSLTLLESNGVQERLINIMEGINSLPVTARGLPSTWHEYRQYLVIYVTSRTSGVSHDTAVGGLRALIVETLKLANDQ